MTKRSREYFRQEKEFREWMKPPIHLWALPGEFYSQMRATKKISVPTPAGLGGAHGNLSVIVPAPPHAFMGVPTRSHVDEMAHMAIPHTPQIMLLSEPVPHIEYYRPHLYNLPIIRIPELMARMQEMPNEILSCGNIMTYDLSKPLWDDRDQHPVTGEKLDYE